MTDQNMALLTSQIDTERKEIKTDSYAMSVGELISLYKEGELELTPNYQRLFRWDIEHKTKFIESILIGIPLPPIFVAQKKGAKWSIVDGLQRVSTILQLCGELEIENQDGEIEILTFIKPEKLTAMDGMTWETLDDDTKRVIKRTKFDIKIILVEDSVVAQYELFKRLNTGAVHLEPQEIRNCLLIMLNEDFYTKINELKNFPAFKNCIKLSDNKYKIEYHMELILRYFIIHHDQINFSEYKSSILLSDFFDREATRLLGSNFNLNDEIELFKRVFTCLERTIAGNAFRKFDYENDKFEPLFSVLLFDVITLGLSSKIDEFEEYDTNTFIELIKGISKDEKFLQISSERGIKAINRISNMIDISKQYFKL